jgi:hypothetical protein
MLGRQYGAVTCLLAARRDGRNARLAFSHTTIEGDPIVTYVFVRGRLPVLVVVDATRDDFGPRVWTRRRCDEVRMTRETELAFGDASR